MAVGLHVKTRLNLTSLRTTVDTLITHKKLKVGILDKEKQKIAQYIENGWTQVVNGAQSKMFKRDWNTKVPYGAIMELPPRPFISGTIAYHRDEWRDLLKSLIKDAIDGRKRGYIRDLEAGMQLVGEVAMLDMKQTIDTKGASSGMDFEDRHELTQKLYRNSGRRDPDSPLLGDLKDYIVFDVK